jgi:hypothetical protein
MNNYYLPGQDWISAMTPFMGLMVTGLFAAALCESIVKGPLKSEEELLPAVEPRTKLKIWDVVDREKLRQYCEQVYGVPVAHEASDYFARLMDRRIEGFKPYLPLHLIDHRGLTAKDMYRAASQYFG